MAKATFGAGCFWGVEVTFRQLEGVLDAQVGYMGGHLVNPTYQDVCTGTTGHAVVLLVEFDPEQISYEALQDIFWKADDPTQLNRQGPDVGTQYRSGIYYEDEAQRATAESSRASLEQSGQHSDPIATEIAAASEFYRAEEYHQQYLEKRGLGSCHLP